MKEQQALGLGSDLGELKKQSAFLSLKEFSLMEKDYFPGANVQTMLLTVLSFWQITEMAQETRKGMSLALFYF